MVLRGTKVMYLNLKMERVSRAQMKAVRNR